MWQLIRQQQSFQMQCILNPHIYTGNRALRVTGGKGGRFIQRFHGASGQLDVVRPCDLETWLTNHGGVVDGAKLHTQRQPDGRACRRLEATKDIKPGSCIISVPRVAQIRYDAIQDRHVGDLIQRIPHGSDTGKPAWQFKQACALLYHLSLGEDSSLHPYIQALPGLAPGIGVPCVGMLLPEDLLQEIQCPSLQHDIQNHKYWWDRFTKHELITSKQVFNGMHVDRALFGWAISMVISRSFALSSQGTHSMPALIDMADHSLSSNSEIRGQESGDIVMTSKEAIKKGDTITISYGQHSNSELVLSYGFVLPGNPNVEYKLDYSIELLQTVIDQMFGQWVNSPLSAWQVEALDRIHGSMEGKSVKALHNTLVGASGSAQAPIKPQLLASMRVLMLHNDAKSIIKSMSTEDLGSWSRPIARQHEVDVLKALSGLLAIVYRGLPTTIQQDRELLKALDAAKTSSINVTNPTCAKGQQQQIWSSPSEIILPCRDEGYRLCLEYRLAMKLSLEAAVKALQARVSELQNI